MNLQIQHIAKKFHNGTKALTDVDFSRLTGGICLGDRAFGGGEDNALSHSQWNDGVHWRTGASG